MTTSTIHMIRNIVFTCFIFSGCATNKITNGMPFDKEGHRGCRGLMPENTVPAMIRAINLGVTTLEMDVCFTADRKAILSHEPFFNHEISTRPDGTPVSEQEEQSLNLYRMTYEEVKKFDVGLRQHPRFPAQQKMKAVKPLLAEVIDSAEAYCRLNKRQPVFYNIETKTMPETDDIYHPAPDVFVRLLMEVINSRNITSRVIIESFDIRTLQYLHQHYPSIMTSLLIEKAENKTVGEKIKALGFTPSVISPEYTMVDQQMIIEAHKRHIRVIPWTVNDAKTTRLLKSMHADGLISDFPDLY